MKITLHGVGDVLVEHSHRARRVILTVSPSRVRVAVPAGFPLSAGMDFAHARKDWIVRHCRRMRVLAESLGMTEQALPPLDDIPGACAKIANRLEALSRKTGLPYGRVTVRNQKTRWGSCSMRGDISLNINLVRLPGHLMDYVILHELLHTRIRGHGRAFWAGLGRLAGDVRCLRAELRRYACILTGGEGLSRRDRGRPPASHHVL
ncbi:MAG TPA: M48 family metallopeptidase [Deltaproteobacteria bacterium]|nr:M48 family metallopeptidase [Deltaproteobacteria bacterium]HQI80475.1 M48 family metallopeptidase [Deltaproteobacteria bacterium]